MSNVTKWYKMGKSSSSKEKEIYQNIFTNISTYFSTIFQYHCDIYSLRFSKWTFSISIFWKIKRINHEIEQYLSSSILLLRLIYDFF